jgi:hypothetical protein
MYKCYENISIFDLPLILTREGLLSFLFGLIFIKKIIKLDLKKKKPKPVQTDLFRFGSVILEQKPVQISFSVWLGFSRFGFGFFGFRLIKPKPNRSIF